ncbi:glycoside hydrolase family 15 protein [Rhodococcus aerolatus]
MTDPHHEHDATAAAAPPGGGPRDPAGYADLRSYAAIGDGRTVALVARDGRIDWFPAPHLDAPPAFAALLDADHGGFVSLRPVEDFTVEREYVAGTNVLATTFTTASGRVRVTDALNTGVAGRLPWSELARRVDGLEGSVAMHAEVSPGTVLNTVSPWVQETTHGAVLRVDGLTLAVRTLGECEATVSEQHIEVDLVTGAGSRHLLALVATDREALFLPDPAVIDTAVDRTIANWRDWTSAFEWDGPWEDAVRRSALLLKLLIHAPTGAIAAAATTSLPEDLTGGKNWDYRFAWVRDMAYTLTALFRFGLREETHAAVTWLLGTIADHGPQPRVFFRLDGTMPDGTAEPDVPGWRGVGPVVDGNAAADQLQLGVFGDLFTTVRLFVDRGNVLDAATGRLLASIADQACDAWHRKDSGMWELPELAHYTTSKLGCWEALECAVHLAEVGQVPGDPGRWRSEAGRIRTWVEDHCWDAERGAYVMAPGSDRLDASILLHAISGFDRGERMASTVDALRRELGSGPHLYRYSGMRQEEGTFVACSFWTVSALHHLGRSAEAHDLMDELVAAGNDVGLYAEMIDPATGDFLGNLPQALSHLALVNAAITLTEDGAA